MKHQQLCAHPFGSLAVHLKPLICQIIFGSDKLAYAFFAVDGGDIKPHRLYIIGNTIKLIIPRIIEHKLKSVAVELLRKACQKPVISAVFSCYKRSRGA